MITEDQDICKNFFLKYRALKRNIYLKKENMLQRRNIKSYICQSSILKLDKLVFRPWQFLWALRTWVSYLVFCFFIYKSESNKKSWEVFWGWMISVMFSVTPIYSRHLMSFARCHCYHHHYHLNSEPLFFKILNFMAISTRKCYTM